MSLPDLASYLLPGFFPNLVMSDVDITIVSYMLCPMMDSMIIPELWEKKIPCYPAKCLLEGTVARLPVNTWNNLYSQELAILLS